MAELNTEVYGTALSDAKDIVANGVNRYESILGELKDSLVRMQEGDTDTAFVGFHDKEGNLINANNAVGAIVLDAELQEVSNQMQAATQIVAADMKGQKQIKQIMNGV